VVLLVTNWSYFIPILGGGFKHFLFSSLIGGDFQFDEHIFQMGWFNHQPAINGLMNGVFPGDTVDGPEIPNNHLGW